MMWLKEVLPKSESSIRISNDNLRHATMNSVSVGN